jgi:hypothetical protein
MNKNCGFGINARASFLAAVLAAFIAGCGSGDGGKIFGSDSGGPGISGSPGPAGSAPALGAAGAFAGLSGGSAGMTNDGTLTVITGAQGQPVSIGTTGASTLVTGFHDTSVAYVPPPGQSGCTYTETTSNIGRVDGTINTDAPPPDPIACPNEGTAATKALADAGAAAALAAYNDLAARSGGIDLGNGELGGRTLAPGVYKSAPGTYNISLGDLTLDAGGNPNAVWVFQLATALTVGIAGPTGARSVILIGGAQPKNVFWQVGSAATINGAGGGTMVGTIIATQGVTFSTTGNLGITTLNGRALSLVASVTMTNTHINVPAP